MLQIKILALPVLIVSAVALSGCSTMMGKSAAVSPAPVAVAQTAPVDADIQRILAAGGMDVGSPTAAALQTPEQVPVSPVSAEIATAPSPAVLPTPEPVAVAELQAPGVQNIDQSQIYQFPSPAISMVPQNYDGLPAPVMPTAGILPPPPVEQRVVVISGPDAQPIEEPKRPRRAETPPAPGPMPECVALARANIPDPACNVQGKAPATGPAWKAPAITANVATPAAPVRRF